MKDTELFLKFKNGDKTAFRKLVEKYQSSVINTCYRFLRNKQEAEETAQEVFLKVYLSLESYKPQANFSTWLFKIVVNLCLNKLRDKRKKGFFKKDFSNREPISEDQDVPAPKENQPDYTFEQKELKKIIKEAIDSLPEKQRNVILLSQYEGFSYQEMAKILDCSVSAIESRLFRGKENLKKKLKSFWEKGAI
jgi:RNA polymerase sigma-70 factor (ECF subfamily)